MDPVPRTRNGSAGSDPPLTTPRKKGRSLGRHRHDHLDPNQKPEDIKRMHVQSSPKARLRRQRVLAELLFLGHALRTLSRPVVGLFAVGISGAVLHHHFGAPVGGSTPPWGESFFVAYCLLFVEHTAALPEHLIGQFVHYTWPLLGIFFLAEGLIKLGITVFKKEANNNVWSSIMAKVTHGHVVLCGLGTVGFRVFEELVGLHRQVFVVERDETSPFLDRARHMGAQVVVGDARGEGVLQALNLATARAVIVATDDDLANLEIAMDVREIRGDIPIVMRLYDQRLAQKVRHILGVEVSFSTSRLAAPLFASAALDPAVVGTHRVGDDVLLTLQLEVDPKGVLADATVKSAEAHPLSVVATRRGTDPWHLQPPPDAKLAPGDTIQVMVPSDKIDEIHRLNGRT
jgi:Trk K+ transport system NAD-binding subunit